MQNADSNKMTFGYMLVFEICISHGKYFKFGFAFRDEMLSIHAAQRD